MGFKIKPLQRLLNCFGVILKLGMCAECVRVLELWLLKLLRRASRHDKTYQDTWNYSAKNIWLLFANHMPQQFFLLNLHPWVVLPERHRTVSTQFYKYRAVILGLLHIHAIGVFKVSYLGKCNSGQLLDYSIQVFHIHVEVETDWWLASHYPK